MNMEEQERLLKANEFLSVYYNLKEYEKKEHSYQDVYYRLYGLSRKTHKYQNVPYCGRYFNEIGEVYEYVGTIDRKEYFKIDIIEYNPITHEDSYFDSISFQKPFSREKKKNNNSMNGESNVSK